MNKKNYTFDDLEDILAEFSDKSAPTPEKPSRSRHRAAPAEPETGSFSPAGNTAEEFEAVFANRPTVIHKPAEPFPKIAKSADSGMPKEKPYIRPTSVRDIYPAEYDADVVKAAEPVRPKESASAAVSEAAPVRDIPALLGLLLSLVFAGVCAFVLGWVLLNVHPSSGTVSTAKPDAKLQLSRKLDEYMNNMASDALGEQAYIRKIYTLQESDTVSPVPDPDGFGITDDPAVIQEVIKKASVLLDGQKVSFDPNASFVPGTPFRYYLDDTILVIAWQEYINERCCTCAEVKLAHGSQIRRKLAEDSYGSSVQLYASDMANSANAVVAINGDFYAFRDLGITAYQRRLYRNNPAAVDSCFFTASGDMLFSRAGELMEAGETEQFMQDNDVVFAIAFGPVLVDNGELQYCEHYPIGEIDTEYSRSCIAMTDELHYFLMTINHTEDGRPRCNINELARFIYSKGVQKACALDGGQTSEIVMMGGPINHVDFNAERTVSDIIYFATAIPDEEVSR